MTKDNKEIVKMDENEKEEFKAHIVKQVSDIVGAQASNNKENWSRFNAELTHRLEVTMPKILKEFNPKTNYWFALLNSAFNGVMVGLAIFIAMKFTGA